ncbi:hypothetical protein ACNKHX_21410 [Shigella flexneri]
MRIGKKGMTYALGMSAQMTAAVSRPGELYLDAGFHHSRTLLFVAGTMVKMVVAYSVKP